MLSEIKNNSTNYLNDYDVKINVPKILKKRKTIIDNDFEHIKILKQ
jgi:hypothetical protein